jgi:hypothetical protein
MSGEHWQTFTLRESIDGLSKDLSYELERWQEGRAYGGNNGPWIKTIVDFFEQPRIDTTHDMEVIDSVARALVDSQDCMTRALGMMLMTSKGRVKKALDANNVEKFSRSLMKPQNKEPEEPPEDDKDSAF